MPYKDKSELPDSVKSALGNLPHAQEIYKEAFNNAWDEYKSSESRKDNSSREETAHRVAWSAVKQKYHKTSDGWHLKK